MLTLLVGLLVAAAVTAYAAYPQRGRDLPVAPHLGEAMRRGIAALPVLGADEEPSRQP